MDETHDVHASIDDWALDEMQAVRALEDTPEDWRDTSGVNNEQDVWRWQDHLMSAVEDDCRSGACATKAQDMVWQSDLSVHSVMTEARARIQRVHAGYEESGLIRKAEKARCEEPEMTLWGASVSDSRKDVRGSLEKIKVLVVLTAQLLTARTASSDE
eukprot:4928463-Amphidinium_carterae.2